MAAATSTTVTEDHRPLVIFGPSGVGKGTLYNMLFKVRNIFRDERIATLCHPPFATEPKLTTVQQYPDTFALSVSHTTRSARPGEEDGVHYHFGSFELAGDDT